jgi:hypothetical protein
MRVTHAPTWVGIVLGALGTGALHAQQAAPAVAPAQPPSIDELLRRLDTLEDRNRELEQRVADLSQQQGETWLGEQRAAQVREIVADVLADSQTRASLQDNGMTAGWNDGFFLASADGRFRLNIGGFVQSRFTFSNIHPGPYDFGQAGQNQFVFDRLENRYGFGLPEVQLWADGHLFSRDFQYMVKARFFEQVATQFGKANAGATPGAADFSGFELLDAWIRVNMDDNWSVRVGQYRMPYSRGFLVQEQYQMSAARSVVDFHYALGYTQGIELEYVNDEFRARLDFDNGAPDNLLGDPDAFTGGNLYKVYPTGTLGGQNNPWWTQNSNYSVTGRIEWKPAGTWRQFRSFTSPVGETFGLLMGLGAHWQQSNPYQTNAQTPNFFGGTNALAESQWVALTFDAQANFGGASLYGAFFWNYIDAPTAMEPLFGGAAPGGVFNLGALNILSFQLMGAVYLMPKWELFARYEFSSISGENNGFLNNAGAGGNPALASPGTLNLLTAGVNWYIDGQDLKWTTDIGWAITDMHAWYSDMQAGWRPSRANEIVVHTQIQMMF